MRLALLFLAALALIWIWGWSSRADGDALARQRAQASAMAPALILPSLGGLCSGLARRERLRAGDEGHSSPLRAWIGKHLAVAGLLLPVSWPCTPLPLDGAWLWAAAAAMAAGVRLHVGHLPTKL